MEKDLNSKVSLLQKEFIFIKKISTSEEVMIIEEIIIANMVILCAKAVKAVLFSPKILLQLPMYQLSVINICAEQQGDLLTNDFTCCVSAFHRADHVRREH